MNKKLFSRTDILFFLIFLLLLLFVFRAIIFTDSIFFERDSTLLEIPARMLCVKLIKEGNFALWTDAYGDGQPFLANMKHAVLYPSTLLYLIFPFFAAFKLHYLIHFVLGWLGMYYFCKSYTLSQQASFFGATVFIFSGIVLSSVEFYNHIASLCWMPWILLVLHRYSKKFFLKLIILAFLWALLILAGTPYVIIMTMIFTLVQSIFIRAKRKRKLAILFLSLMLAFFLCSAQLIPTMDLILHSDRGEALTPTWSFESLQMFNFVFPNILGNDREPGHEDYWGSHLFDKGFPLYYSLYVGFGVLVLFFFILAKPYDSRHLIFLISFGIFILLALGAYTPLYSIWKLIPPFSAIRYPVKYLTGVTFSLAMISSIAFDNIFTLNKCSRRKSVLFFKVSVILFVLYLILKGPLVKILSDFFVITKVQSVSELEGSLMRGLFLFMVCSFIIFIHNCNLLTKKILSCFFLGIVVLDLILINQFINPTTSVSFFKKPLFLGDKKLPIKIYREEYTPFAFKDEVGGRYDLHNYLKETLFPFSAIGHDVKYLFCKDFYDLYEYEYKKVINNKIYKGELDRLKVLISEGCEYYIGHHPLSALPALEMIIEGYTVYFQKIPNSLELPRLMYYSIRADSFEKKLNIFLREDFNVAKTAIVDNDFDLRSDINNINNKEDRIIPLEEFQGSGKYLIRNACPTIAVFSGNYRNGWNAWVDGKKTGIFKVNLASKGVFLPAGKHEIKLKYYPKSFRYGLLLSIASMLVVFFFLLVSFLVRKKKLDIVLMLNFFLQS